MKKLNCAVVGLGAIGPTHVKSILETPNANLYAVCDIVPEKADKYAAETGCKAFYDFDEMIKDPAIDLVHICLPSGMHADFGCKAALAGKNVLVEKPIDVTLEAADRLIRTCHEAGVVLSCISQHRFDPDIEKAKEAIEKGEMGRIVFGASHTKWYRSQEYYDSGDWRGTWALDGGGALMNQSVHYVDMVQYLAGPVEEVTARTGLLAHERIEVEDVAVATLKFKSGALGLLEGNTACFPGLTTRLDIYGTDGLIVIEGDHIKEWRTRADVVGTNFYNVEVNKKEESREKVDASLTGASSAAITASSHQREIQDVVDAVLEGRSPAVTGEEARRPLAVILAVYESARKGGMPVKVDGE